MSFPLRLIRWRTLICPNATAKNSTELLMRFIKESGLINKKQPLHMVSRELTTGRLLTSAYIWTPICMSVQKYCS